MLREGERYVLRWERSAREVVERLESEDKSLAAAILSVVDLLATDPYYNRGGQAWVETKTFVALRNAGFPTRILKAQEIDGWRVFYFVIEKPKLVLVKELVPREDDEITYGRDAPHVQRLKRNYLKVMGKSP